MDRNSRERNFEKTGCGRDGETQKGKCGTIQRKSIDGGVGKYSQDSMLDGTGRGKTADVSHEGHWEGGGGTIAMNTKT